MCCRTGRVIFQHPGFHRVVCRFLQEHPAQLSASQYSSFDHIMPAFARSPNDYGVKIKKAR
jgi:hypothetical protein